MLRNRNRTERNHDDSLHWAGPGLVRMVCRRCGRVSIDLSRKPAGHQSDQDLGVEALGWLVAESAR
jgi:hypothetical protein